MEIEPAGPLSGTISAPASKSVTNRLLVIAALAEGESTLRRPLVSEDTVAMATGLVRLGIDLDLDAGRALVEGGAGVVGPPTGVIEAGLSGTTLRFLAALSLLSVEPVTLDGDSSLRRRPLGALLEALERSGASVRSEGGRPPVVISGGGLAGGRIAVDAAESSQFASALLLVAPYARQDVELSVSNLGAGGYVEMTASCMRRWGAAVEEVGESLWSVSASRRYSARDEPVEYDASAAAHLFALALATGGEITVENTCDTLQPDARILETYEEMGARVTRLSGGGTTVEAAGGLSPITADLEGMPDQVVTLAALAVLAPGVSRLTGLSVARGHETDRLEALAAELGKLGVEVETGPDSLTIRGGPELRGGRVKTYQDHRMAMGLSLLGTVFPGIAIEAPSCVAKTYPGWWSDIASLGVRLSR